MANFGRLDQAVRTFGNRYARRMILRRSFGDSHPVLQVENNLVEMARSQLQEVILATLPNIPETTRGELVRSLRRAASERILASEEDEEVKEDMLTDVENEDFADLFHSLH